MRFFYRGNRGIKQLNYLHDLSHLVLTEVYDQLQTKPVIVFYMTRNSILAQQRQISF